MQCKAFTQELVSVGLIFVRLVHPSLWEDWISWIIVGNYFMYVLYDVSSLLFFRSSVCIFAIKQTQNTIMKFILVSICLSWVSISVGLSVCPSVCRSVCLHVCLSVCLFVFLYVCLPIFLYVCLSFCLSVSLYICLSLFESVRLTFSLLPFLTFSLCLSVCLSLSAYYKSVCLSLHLPISLCPSVPLLMIIEIHFQLLSKCFSFVFFSFKVP